MKQTLIGLLLLSGLLQQGFADFSFKDQLLIPWGTESGQIPLKETPAGWLSVSSFEVIGENIYLMTAEKGLILSFSREKTVSVNETGISGARDFILDQNGQLRYIMDSKAIYEYIDQTRRILWSNPWNQHPNSRFLRTNQNSPVILANLSETILPTSPRPEPRPGVLNRLEQTGQMLRRSNHEMIFLLNGIQLAAFQPDQGIWGSGQYLGCNKQGDHYILLETILKNYPLMLKREIRITNSQGKSLTALEIPDFLHVPVSREFQIEADGSIYELITAEDGAHIVQWKFSGSYPDHFVRTSLSSQYQHILVRPFSGDRRLPQPPESDEKVTPESEQLDFPPVERGEAVETGADYVDLIWTTTSANLTNGLIDDPAGHAVQTPDWVVLGQNQQMVYQWGGFSTIDGFLSGLANGKYAGDMATSEVSSYAVGVDCSGFVCRCWNMPQHYSTWMMSNTQPLITLPLDSWYDLLPGDAIHKVGHVRMTVLWNTNGTILAVEAGGNWITHYQSYAISQLADYQPRYYVNMQGMPATLEQPVLSSLCTRTDSSVLTWSFNDTAGIQGVHIYAKDIFEAAEWTIINESPVPVALDSLALTGSGNSIAYQLRSVSDDGTATESYPSDSYALVHKNSTDRLLIVDGFDRTSGSYPFPYHDFSLRLAEALGRFTLSYETVDNDALIDGSVDLADYTAVFWLVGDESTLDETFSNTEQDLVEDYLEQGGKLFASGSEIAWDLYAQGSTSDQSFIHNYLKSGYGADDSESYVINGVTGTPFDGISLNFDDGNDGVYKEDYPDALLTNGGSQAILRYANNMIAGTAYSGSFGGGTNSGQVILLGIPFETIYSETQRLDLVTAILEYFELSTVLTTRDQPAIPMTQLLKPFPSPFNSTAQIRFRLNQPGSIDLRVFDLQGREVALLSEQHYESGTWQLPFHAHGLASGIYLIRLKTDNSHQSQKIIYLK